MINTADSSRFPPLGQLTIHTYTYVKTIPTSLSVSLYLRLFVDEDARDSVCGEGLFPTT